MRKIVTLAIILLAISSMHAVWVSADAVVDELFTCEFFDRNITELESKPYVETFPVQLDYCLKCDDGRTRKLHTLNALLKKN